MDPNPAPTTPTTPALVDASGFRAAVGRAMPRLAARVGATGARVFGNRHARAFGILNYHRVAPVIPGLPPPTWNVSPDVLREQLGGLLRRGYRPWRMADLLAAHAAGTPIPRAAFGVTFDDGYENLLTRALPVLRELNVPAAVFLATAYLDSQERFPFDDWPPEQARKAPPDYWRPLSTAQCRELVASGLVDLGTHTHTHADFRNRPDVLAAELALSSDVLRERFGIHRPMFAFPYGVTALGFAGGTLADAARGAGVTCALTTDSDLIRPGDDPFHWGRFNVKDADLASSLAGRLSGWYHVVRDAWRGVKRFRKSGT
jgi:peptidoglycan/xylan/chitin deacetylase (PgdA/CDA1 family)